MRLSDKVVVITGSGSGIGAACARRFVAEGAKVVVTDQNAEGVDEVASEIGTVGLAVDISSEDGVIAVAELARRTYGEIDLWFTNAGVSGPRQAFDIQDNDIWQSFWALHVMSHVYAVRAVLPSMLERGDGYLLQTASKVAITSLMDKAAYSVTKHAALALAEWLGANYRSRGIKVSCFVPGAMLTPMLLQDPWPAGHPVFDLAMTPENVASLIVEGIDRERFLIVDAPDTTSELAEKAQDYDAWLAKRGASQY
jgi:NAD(P)-dependent dehydrogenase (short-subunit alcohol dehydrogenase family)